MAAELDLGAATIIELGERIRRRELSPVELIEATNARIERLQPLLHSFVTHSADYALERARQAESEIAANRYRGPLHGIPYTLKDVIATRGVRTTFGNPRGVDYRPPEQATLHRLLEEAGAILVGKVVSEIGRDTSGPVGCRNAWDPTRSPGTSSSGSGSATAASMGLLSIGTDTGGSVRHPGSNSSLVAMKPTFGRVSRHGIWAASWSDDTAGPLTKTVEDNAAALEAIGVYDPLDPLSINEPALGLPCRPWRFGIAGVRIGVPVDDWIWRDWLTEEEEEIVRAAIERLGELGAVLSEVRMPLAEHSRNRALGLSLASERPVFIRDHFSEEEIEAWTEIHATDRGGRGADIRAVPAHAAVPGAHHAGSERGAARGGPDRDADGQHLRRRLGRGDGRHSRPRGVRPIARRLPQRCRQRLRAPGDLGAVRVRQRRPLAGGADAARPPAGGSDCSTASPTPTSSPPSGASASRRSDLEGGRSLALGSSARLVAWLGAVAFGDVLERSARDAGRCRPGPPARPLRQPAAAGRSLVGAGQAGQGARGRSLR